MRNPNQRGSTLPETLVYSALACLICVMLSIALIEYRKLSTVFEVRTEITTTTNRMFSDIRNALTSTNAQGVLTDSSGQMLGIQAVVDTNNQAKITWDDEVLIFFYEPEQNAVLTGRVAVSDISPDVASGTRIPMTDSDLSKAVRVLKDTKQARPTLRDTTGLQFGRPVPEEVSVKLTREKKSYQKKVEKVQRESSFPIMLENRF